MKLFYKLLDLIRSPELIKMVTGELDEHVVKDRDRHIKEQIWVVKRKMFLDQTEQAKENEK